MQRLTNAFFHRLQPSKSCPEVGTAGQQVSRLRRHLPLLAMVAALAAHTPCSAIGTLPSTVKLAWSPNPEKNIAGYELRYGMNSGQYQSKIDVGLETTATVSGLSPGTAYYFVVTAYNKAGLRSLPSAEVVYGEGIGLPNEAPGSAIKSPAKNVTIRAGQTVEFSGSGRDPDGDTPLKYQWNFGTGSGIAPTSAKNPGSRQFKIPGTYQVTFTVTDSKGRADPSPATRTITVVRSNIGWNLKSEPASALKSSPAPDEAPWISTEIIDGLKYLTLTAPKSDVLDGVESDV
jgi:chitodextrinase